MGYLITEVFQMLTDEQKLKIREEEIFRSEIRESIEKEKKANHFGKKVLDFFNTSLGIWILSSIVLGLFAWTYAQWQASQQNREQIQKLDIEIATRLEVAHDYLNWENVDNNESPNIIRLLLHPPSNERMIQPEFANRNLRSLLYELKARLPVNQQRGVFNAIEACRVLNQIVDDPPYPNEINELKESVRIMRRQRQEWESILLGRHLEDNALRNYLPQLLIFVIVVLIGCILIYKFRKSSWIKPWNIFRKPPGNS